MNTSIHHVTKIKCERRFYTKPACFVLKLYVTEVNNLAKQCDGTQFEDDHEIVLFSDAPIKLDADVTCETIITDKEKASG